MTQNERLLHAYNMFKTVPAETINMHVWYHLWPMECGTTACFLGHCALDPTLAAEGLYLLKGDPVIFYKAWDNCELFGREAGQHFFGLTPDESEYLFYMPNDSSGKEATRQNVLRMLEGIMDDRGIDWR